MSRNSAQERTNLEQFVESHGGCAYINVPVSGPSCGWDARDPVHLVDAVWFETDSLGRVVPWDDADPSEFKRLLASTSATLISPRGYADRTAFGMLIACRELFSRAYPNHQLLRALALTEKMSRRSIVYLAEGIQVIRPDGTAPQLAGNRGPYRRGEPEEGSAEDRLLKQYYEVTLDAQGTLWQEVPVADAALDGLYIRTRQGGLQWWPLDDSVELADEIATSDVEIVEVKRVMNMDVIGQSIAGAIVLAHTHPEHRLISQTIVVGGNPDACLDWVCHKRGIAVARFELQ